MLRLTVKVLQKDDWQSCFEQKFVLCVCNPVRMTSLFNVCHAHVSWHLPRLLVEIRDIDDIV